MEWKTRPSMSLFNSTLASTFISLFNMFIFIQCWTQDQWKIKNWTTTDANIIYTTCKIKPSLFSVLYRDCVKVNLFILTRLSRNVVDNIQMCKEKAWLYPRTERDTFNKGITSEVVNWLNDSYYPVIRVSVFRF